MRPTKVFSDCDAILIQVHKDARNKILVKIRPGVRYFRPKKIVWLIREGRKKSLTTYSPAFLNQFETMIAQAVDRRSSAMQQQLDDQAGLIKEVKEQNQRLQEDLSRKEAMSNKQSIMLMASVLKMQANDIRTRIRLYNDRQNQLTRVQARVTTKKGNKADQEADLLLLEELKQGQAAERQDIARATSKLRDEAQLYEVQLSMADIQDFVNRPA